MFSRFSFCLILTLSAFNARAQMLDPGYGTIGAPMSNFISSSYLSKQVMNDVVFKKNKAGNTGAQVNRVTVARAAPIAPQKLAAGYPDNTRAEAEQLFAKLLELYPQVERQYGIPANDLGGVVGLFLVASYEAYHTSNLDPAKIKAVIAQMRSVVGSNPEIAKAASAEKQEMYEQLAILGMFAASINNALQTSPEIENAQQIEANLRQAGKSYLEQFLKTEADRVEITDEGLIVKG